MHHYQNKRDTPGDFFPMPKAAFRLGLDSGEIAVLAFLMYCEDRKTYQCHPSYSTIGSAVGMSNNTVKKYVDRLEHKRKKFNVYAKTREECEKLLAEMITEKKSEIAAEKAKTKTA